MTARISTLVAGIAIAITMAPSVVRAGDHVQRPNMGRVDSAHTTAIHRARKQRLNRGEVRAKVSKALRLAKALPLTESSYEFAKVVAETPLKGRVTIFKALVARAVVEAKRALGQAQREVQLKRTELSRAQQSGNADVIRDAELALRTAAQALEAAKKAAKIEVVKSHERRVRGSIYRGNRRNENEKLVDVVEAGGMAGIGLQLVESGKVTVNKKVVTDPNQRLSKKDVVVVATEGWKGLIKQHTTLSSSKTFFEVTEHTLPIFNKVMGPSAAWYGSSLDPSHLHTLVADQAGRGKLHHNVYGTNFDTATVNPDYTQMFLPLLYTPAEMDRFVRYMNAAKAKGYDNRGEVFGFYSRGKKIDKTRCTNWATAAQIGQLPRWARRVDKKVRALRGVPEVVAEKGLYMALVEAPNAEARQQIVAKVLRVEGHSKVSFGDVKKMARKISRVIDDRLQSWVVRTDTMVQKLAREGAINVPEVVAHEGLYKALKNAESGDARRAIVDAVMAEGNLPQLFEKTRENITKVARHFEGQAGSPSVLNKADFPARPADLTLRNSQAGEKGLSRSQDPAMWLTGLMLHPDASVVAVFKGPEAFSAELSLGLELMGEVGPDGRIQPNANPMTDAGIKHPNKGAVAVQATRESPVASPEAGNE